MPDADDGEPDPPKGKGKGKTSGEKPAKPSTRSKGVKEPAKAQVDVVASTAQDVYALIDAAVNMWLTYQGYDYPEGLLDLDDETAAKLARASIKMNNALPKVIEKSEKFTAPLGLAAVLLTDLGAKGVALYGVIQQGKRKHPNQAISDASSAFDRSRSVNDIDPRFRQ